MSDNEELKNQENPDQDNIEATSNESGNEENKTEKPCPDAVIETMESLQQKVNEWQDKYMRLFADFENFKKRMRQEKFDLLQTAGSDADGRIVMGQKQRRERSRSFPEA